MIILSKLIANRGQSFNQNGGHYAPHILERKHYCVFIQIAFNSWFLSFALFRRRGDYVAHAKHYRIIRGLVFYSRRAFLF